MLLLFSKIDKEFLVLIIESIDHTNMVWKLPLIHSSVECFVELFVQLPKIKIWIIFWRIVFNYWRTWTLSTLEKLQKKNCCLLIFNEVFYWLKIETIYSEILWLKIIFFARNSTLKWKQKKHLLTISEHDFYEKNSLVFLHIYLALNLICKMSMSDCTQKYNL